MICPFTFTCAAGRTIGRLCPALDDVLAVTVAFIILVGSDVASCVIGSCPRIGEAWTVFD